MLLYLYLSLQQSRCVLLTDLDLEIQMKTSVFSGNVIANLSPLPVGLCLRKSFQSLHAYPRQAGRQRI